MTRKTNNPTTAVPTAAAPTNPANEKTVPPAATPTASAGATDPVPPSKTPKPLRDTKLRAVEALLRRDGGASIAELMSATGWQQHSVRGVLAGTLKRKGLVIASVKIDGERRYYIAAAA